MSARFVLFRTTAGACIGRATIGLVAGLCVVLGGCSNTPLPEYPVDDIPHEWRGADGSANAWPDIDWWEEFESDELVDLIARVKSANLDLQNSERNMRAAELALIDAGLDRWPAPVLSAGASGAYAGSRSPDGDFQDGGTESVDLSLAVDYADILAKRPRHSAAASRYASSLARAADLRLRILTSAASAYFQILLLRDRMEAARQNLANAQAIEGVVRARVTVGTSLASEELRQRIVVRRQRNEMRTLELDLLRVRASLALLLGDSVWDSRIAGTTLADLQVPDVGPGLPSELLVRRPDVVQAEAALREARANVDLARLAFLPRIALTGGANSTSDSLAAFLGDGTSALTVTSSMALTLFDIGRRHRNVETSRLQLQSLLADYRRTVIAAFNEVEVTLATIDLLRSLGEVLAEDIEFAEESLRIAEARYREGVQEFEALLGAQDTLYGARNAYLNNKLATLQASIDLYVALGGGWRAMAR